MYQPPHNNFIYCSYRISVQFQDEIGNQKNGRGTGFFVSNGENIAFVTNRHMLDGQYKRLDVHNSTKLADLRILGKSRQDDTYELKFRGNQAVLFPDSFENDVACIINPEFDVVSGRADIFYKFDIRELADEYQFSEGLWLGEQVFFAGFSDEHDKLAQRPILRSGTIASDPRRRYSFSGTDEGERIAYEAFSNEGTSGSPVWAGARGFKGYPQYRPGLLVYRS